MKAGFAAVDISPRKPCFLVGYPHVERTSTGIHDPLYASAACLGEGCGTLLLISLDILIISPATASELRRKIEAATGIPYANMLIACTHTHSGPQCADMLAWKNDPVVPPPDKDYMNFLQAKVVEVAEKAAAARSEAEVAVTSAMVSGAGCNRHSPEGPRDPEIGIIAARDGRTRKISGILVVYSMHPTVLHEDSKLVSSDFPAYARLCLKEKFGDDAEVVYLTGPAGNQSPRYHVRGQTFAEAERIGRIAGEAAAAAVASLNDSDYSGEFMLKSASAKVALPSRKFPSVTEAEQKLADAREKFRRLKEEDAGHGPVRTAECDVFGAEETLTLAKAQEDGLIRELVEKYSPAEITAFRIGGACIVGFPCELFVEYGLELKKKAPCKVFPVSLANGELQGYVVTKEAAALGGYEASNAVFAPESGELMLSAALRLIRELT